MLALAAGYALIFGARVVDMTLATMRILLLVRGKRLAAASIGFAEAIIYILILNYVVKHMEDPFSLLAYGLGFATGNVMGSVVEERLVSGFITVQVITMVRPEELTLLLREAGYGLTVSHGEGREGIHPILHITVARKDLTKLMERIRRWDERAFITILDARAARGGVFQQRKGK